jgi:hypothetical protein
MARWPCQARTDRLRDLAESELLAARWNTPT